MAKSGESKVTKADFLSALVEEYEYEVIGDYYKLRKMIRGKHLSQDNMEDLLIELDPTLEQHEMT